MDNYCLNLDGRIESFPDIQFKTKMDETEIFWKNRPEVYWTLTYRAKEDKKTLDDVVFLSLLGPYATLKFWGKHLKYNRLEKPKSFNGRNALGRLIKFIKNFDYGIS